MVLQKGSKLLYEKLKCQSYLLSNELNMTEKSLLFKLRTQTTEVRANFSSKYVDTTCNLCLLSEVQTDSHLLECPKIIDLCTKLNDDTITEYEDIFEDDESQVRVVKLYEEIFRMKEKLEESNNS